MSLLAEVFSFALSKTSATVAIRASRMVSSMSVLITFTLSDKGTSGGSSPMSANAAPPRARSRNDRESLQRLVRYHPSGTHTRTRSTREESLVGCFFFLRFPREFYCRMAQASSWRPDL